MLNSCISKFNHNYEACTLYEKHPALNYQNEDLDHFRKKKKKMNDKNTAQAMTSMQFCK